MIKKEEVKHIAKLARLGICAKEQEKFQGDLSSILDYFESLNKAKTEGIEPTFHPTERFLERDARKMREDKERASAPELAEKLIEAAPEKEKRHIKARAIF